MARHNKLRLVPPLTDPTSSRDSPLEVLHPAGALQIRGPIPEGERIVDLEGALIRVAEICRDRPDVLKIVAGVLFDDLV
jgi:hypothetical protein